MRKIKFKKLPNKYVFHKRRKFLNLKNHPFIVPVITLLVLLIVTGIGYVLLGSKTVSSSDSHVVILTNDKQRRTIPTSAATVSDFLKKLNIKVNPGDVVEPDLNTEIVEDNFRVNIYKAVPVTIVQGAHKKFLNTAATSPRSIAEEAGIKVYPEDDINIEIPQNILRTGNIGKEVVIKPATPAYLNLYGTPVAVRTHKITVGDLLAEKQVYLSPSDTVQPSITTRITPGISVVVSRQGTTMISKTETIPAPVEIVEDLSLSFGATAVRQHGSPGKKLVTYQVITKNGKVIKRVKIQEIIAEKPVPEIVARGKAVYIPKDRSVIMSSAGIKSSDYPYVSYIINHENAMWCPTRWQGQTSCPAFYKELYPGAETAMIGYGLCQSTPGIKMSTAGSDWRTSAVTQLKWCSGYAIGRYGSWSAAYNYWVSHHNW